MKYSIKMLALMIALVQGTAVMGLEVTIMSAPDNPENLKGPIRATCPKDGSADIMPGQSTICRGVSQGDQIGVDRGGAGTKSHPCVLRLQNNEWVKVDCRNRWKYDSRSSGDQAFFTFYYNSRGW